MRTDVIGSAIYHAMNAWDKLARFVSGIFKGTQKEGKFQKGSVVFGNRTKWYWDVRVWLPVILVLFVASMARKEKVVEYVEVEVPVYVSQMAEDAEGSYTNTDEEKIIAMARFADSVARGRPAEVKRIIMWVLINRSEDRSNGYGGTLMEELARPKQWQEYDPEAVYLESTYQLAREVYQTWQSGGARPIYPDMLWFILNGDGSITVRNQFKVGPNRVEATFGQ